VRKQETLQLNGEPILVQMARAEVKTEMIGMFKALIHKSNTYKPLVKGAHLEDAIEELYHDFYIYLYEHPSALPIDKIYSIAVIRKEIQRFLNKLLYQSDRCFALKKILYDKISDVLRYSEYFYHQNHQWHLKTEINDRIDAKAKQNHLAHLNAFYEQYHQKDQNPILVKKVELNDFLIHLLSQNPQSLNEIVQIAWRKLKPSPEEILRQITQDISPQEISTFHEFSALEWEKKRMEFSMIFVESLNANEKNVGKLLLSDLSLRKKGAILDQSHKNVNNIEKSILKKLKMFICQHILELSNTDFEFTHLNPEAQEKILDFICNIEFDLQLC
jgi:DNA-binding CsgD family transcriptional regulator